MKDVLWDSAFGASLVATGILIAWFGIMWNSPIMWAIGAVYAVVGMVAIGVQLHITKGSHEPEPSDDDATTAISLSSAPKCVRDDIPPSSKLVWMYLATQGESTLDDIVSGTQLSTRTARNAITRLEKFEVISKRGADRGTGGIYYDLRTPDDEVTPGQNDDLRSKSEA